MENKLHYSNNQNTLHVARSYVENLINGLSDLQRLEFDKRKQISEIASEQIGILSVERNTLFELRNEETKENQKKELCMALVLIAILIARYIFDFIDEKISFTFALVFALIFLWGKIKEEIRDSALLTNSKIYEFEINRHSEELKVIGVDVLHYNNLKEFSAYSEPIQEQMLIQNQSTYLHGTICILEGMRIEKNIEEAINEILEKR